MKKQASIAVVAGAVVVDGGKAVVEDDIFYL